MTDIGINIPLVPCSNLSYDSYNDVLITTLVILSSSYVYTFLKDKNCNFWSSFRFSFLGPRGGRHARLCVVKSLSLRSAHNCGGSWIRPRGLTLA